MNAGRGLRSILLPSANMNQITARKAMELVAPFVDLVGNDKGSRDKLLRILSLANQYAWKKGRWLGMTKEFHVRVNSLSREIVTPDGYDTLLKANLDARPVELRGENYQFHKNGNGSLDECCGRNWSGNVTYVGESAVLVQPYNPETCECCLPDCGCYRLAVAAENPVEGDANKHVLVKGTHPALLNEPEKKILSYRSKPTVEDANCRYDCTPIKLNEKVFSEGLETVEGVHFQIKDSFVIMDDICWGRVEYIEKPVTEVYVSVYAVRPDDKFFRIARLAPNQTVSSYKRYRVPEGCCNHPCVHGLFKVSEPATLERETQHLLIGDEEAIIALSMGINELYFRQAPEKSVPYLQRGIMCLEEQSVESEGERVEAIEVSVTEYDECDINILGR